MNNTQRIFINTLNANDVFMFPGTDTRMVCERRFSEGGMTSVTYRPIGGTNTYIYARPGLSTVDLVIED